MHLQQTKAGSRKSGGPQYYFHDLTEPIKDYLRRKGACPVVLQTPYGIAESPFVAVGRDHKLLQNGRVTSGLVGHDRIQQSTGADESIGEAIRYWYDLARGRDFERIDVNVRIDNFGQFILAPLKFHFRGKSRVAELEFLDRPLSFTRRHQSPLWVQHIDALVHSHPAEIRWVMQETTRVAREHLDPNIRDVHEVDLLRVAGAFSRLGVTFSPYSVRYYDCNQSLFSFLNFPAYSCPIEIKKVSRGFKYQMERYKPLRRVVVFCVTDTLLNAPEHVDVIELAHLAEHLRQRLA